MQTFEEICEIKTGRPMENRIKGEYLTCEHRCVRASHYYITSYDIMYNEYNLRACAKVVRYHDPWREYVNAYRYFIREKYRL